MKPTLPNRCLAAHSITCLFLAIATFLLGALPHFAGAADPPGILNHQGRIAVNGTNFDGAGQFKFALVNAAGDVSYWSNDDSSTTGDQPTAGVPVTVTNGHYAVHLGDAPMGIIPASVFAENADVSLRIWFSADGGTVYEQLAPDRRIASVGYALSAQSIMGEGILLGGGNLTLPASTAATGIIRSGSDTLLHTFGTANFFAGTNAGNLTMTGAYNTASGDSALTSNTTGGGNTANGFLALTSNTEGFQNVASGARALTANTTGDYNTATGTYALTANTTGISNTANGWGALRGNTTGGSNAAIGVSALSSNTTGNSNTASGFQSLRDNTAGNNNTASGSSALLSNTTGGSNTAYGNRALRLNTTGYGNTAGGHVALGNNDTGIVNTASGFEALFLNTAGNYNTASGYRALRSNLTGNYNIALGESAGINLTTGDHNIDIGNSGVAAESATIRIGDSDQTRAFIAGDVSTAGAVIPGNNVGAEVAGMIRWTGTDFEGYSGSGWVSLTAQSGVAVTPVANMVWIEPGEFLMGSPPTELGRQEDEDNTAGEGGTQATTLITQGFWMGKYEVTQQEYLGVIGSNPSHFTGNLARPVETVSWSEAQVYCAKLTIQERGAGRLPPGYAYRLPTEAEREYACRAGTTTTFSYGDDNPPAYDSLAAFAVYSVNSDETTHPVGSREENGENPWGLQDMHGNVWEWCQDWYDLSYPGGVLIDFQGPSVGSDHVARGGAYNLFPIHLRSATRAKFAPGIAIRTVGFRVVLAPGHP